MYGISKEQIVIDKNSLLSYIHPDDRAIMQDIYENPPSKQPIHVEFRVIRPDGSILYVYNIMEISFDKEGKPTSIRGITQDITEKKELEKEAELKQEKINKMQRRFNALIKESVEVFEIIDVDGSIVYVNEASEKITGYKIEEQLGKKIYDFYEQEEVQKLTEMMNFVLNNYGKHITRDIVLRTKNGKKIYLEYHMENFLQDSAIEGIVVNFRDITERVLAEKKIIHLSSHDQLTGLPNKIHFDNKLEQLSKSAKEDNTSFAIFMLDIDSVWYIKNTLGYKVTEEYLVQIANRLKSYCGSTKFICRYSDNRFVVIFEGKHTMDEYETFIKGIYELFSKTITVDKYELDVDVSIGVGLNLENKDELIRHAETAIFLAKSMGKNKHVFYSSDLDIQSYKHFILRNDLKRAVENDQLELYYQPIVNLRTNKIIAAEVLPQWEHPEWGAVSSDEFASIAEETGHIIKIGKWLIREVCSMYQKWLNKGLPNIKIAIYFSGMQFLESNFVENIRDTINEYELDPHFLIMKINESILMENVDKVIEDIKRLQSFGIQIAIDNFGMGYSLLPYLNSFNIDILNLDGSCIKKINEDESNTVTTRHIINIAKELKIKLVAKQIETWEQLSFLRELKCYSGQGSLYSKPAPPEDFEKVLAKRKCKPVIANDLEVIEDRRKYFRIKFTQPLEADMSILEIKGKKVNVGSTKVLIKNIGPGGLCFISTIRLPVDEGIILQFKTHLIGEEVRVYGCTVWSGEMDDNLFEYGVKFTFDENKRTDLVRVLNQVQIRMKNDILFADGSFISGSPYVYFKTQ